MIHMIENILVEFFDDLNIDQIEPRNCLSIEAVANNANILLISFVKLQLELAYQCAYNCVHPRVGHANIYQCYWSGTGKETRTWLTFDPCNLNFLSQTERGIYPVYGLPRWGPSSVLA